MPLWRGNPPALQEVGMTEALATLFEGHEIQIVEYNSEVWMPCKDLSLALGLDRTTCYQHAKRKRDFFGDDAQDGDKISQDGDIWVNEKGVYLLLAGISTGTVHSKAKDIITKFRRTVPELLQQYRKKEIVQVPENTLDLELDIARHISEKTGGNLATFQAIALKRCGMEDYIPALKQTSNIEHGESGWYNVTQLCEKYPLAAIEGHPERLNNYLQFKGYIYRENGKPRLQPKGEPHGKEYWFESPHGHREIRIRWRLSIMYACGLVHDDPAPARLGVT